MATKDHVVKKMVYLCRGRFKGALLLVPQLYCPDLAGRAPACAARAGREAWPRAAASDAAEQRQHDGLRPSRALSPPRYICTYAPVHPELSLLAINTLQKDCRLGTLSLSLTLT